MAEIFSQSRELKQIIESYDWFLQDITPCLKNHRVNFEYLVEKPVPEQYEIGHTYLFLPMPKPGESISKAYKETAGVGPAITVPDFSTSPWLTGFATVNQMLGNEPMLLSAIDFYDEYSKIYDAGKVRQTGEHLCISRSKVADVFRDCFFIIEPLVNNMQWIN